MKWPFVSRKKYEELLKENNLLRPTTENVTIDVQLPEIFTKEAYDKIEGQLKDIAQRLSVKTGGLYSSVYTAKIEAVLADLKKKIVPTNTGEDTTAGAIRQSMEEGK